MSSKQSFPDQPYSSERGMISIITTVVMIVVISLIVLGFAQLSRRNQRETLDRQLSTQAFYAAETGINDAREIINAAAVLGTDAPDKSSCTGTGPAGFYSALTPQVDSASSISYSCLLVDASPTTLRYSDVGTRSIVVPVVAADTSASISRIVLDWQSKITSGNPLTGCPTNTNVFTTVSNWTCGYGVLRFDLVPTSGTFTATDLQNRTMTSFLVPYSAGGYTVMPYAAGTANTNVKYGVDCVPGVPGGCTMEITGLTQNSYHMRISSMYRNASLQIHAEDASGSSLSLKGAQVQIDATGKAQDILRRIQVSVPLRTSSKNELPDYAIQTNEPLCKRFVTMDGYYDPVAPGVTTWVMNRLCRD